jgi:hypothetical protein
MPDDVRTQQIEKRIDPEISGAIALSESGGARSIAPENMAQMFEFAKLMAISGPCVRPAFRGSPGACLAIALQAFRTGADPFAVANKAYITTSRSGDEQIAYEAQYIHAVLNTSGKLKKRLRPTYSGAGAKRKCTIIGHVVGEDEPLEYESPTIEEIAVKNSPLWKGDPDQQLFYYSSRAWGRRHLPEVLLGMYTPDEIRSEVIDITPVARPRPEDYATAAGSEPETEQTETETGKAFEVFDFSGEARECRTEEAAIEALEWLIADARTLRELEVLDENNPNLMKFPILIAAYKDKKELFKDPGNGQDRSAAGAQPSDQGQTEHPEGDAQSIPGERSTPQELPAARAATPAAVNRPPTERPRDDLMPAAHAPRDENFWSQSKFVLPGQTAKELLYYTQQYLRQCRDQIDVNGIEQDNAMRFQELTASDRKAVAVMIDLRRKELPA